MWAYSIITMKLLLLQTDIKWNDRDANLQNITSLISASKPADLIIMPEMFTTGYATDPEGIAEEDQYTLESLKRISASSGAAIAGSVAIKSNGEFRNRMYFVRPDGTYDTYDKRHLFSFAGEDRAYTSGHERKIVEWCGFRILLQICYDLRFPVFSRNRSDYDLILYSANWPAVRIEAWNALLKARAIENLSYVAAVNRVGNDPYKDYPGASQVLDYKGHEMVRLPDTQQAIHTEIEKEPLDAFRKRFPALSDADDFKLYP